MTAGPNVRQVWRDAIRDSDDAAIDVYALAVAFALDRHMSADGRTRTGRRLLARLARIGSNRTVGERIDRLIDAGWLERSWAGSGHAATYKAAYPVGHPCGEKRPTGDATTGLPGAQSGLPGRPDPVRPRKRNPEGMRARPESQPAMQALDGMEPPPTAPGHTAVARAILGDWWERQTPRPQQPFPAALKVAAKALRDGWTETDLALALDEVPTISGGALDYWRRRRTNGSANGSGRRSADEIVASLARKMGADQ